MARKLGLLALTVLVLLLGGFAPAAHAKTNCSNNNGTPNDIVWGGVHSKRQLIRLSEGMRDACGHRVDLLWRRLGMTPELIRSMHKGQICSYDDWRTIGRENSPKPSADHKLNVQGVGIYIRYLAVFGTGCYPAWIANTEDGQPKAIMVGCGNGGIKGALPDMRQNDTSGDDSGGSGTGGSGDGSGGAAVPTPTPTAVPTEIPTAVPTDTATPVPTATVDPQAAAKKRAAEVARAKAAKEAADKIRQAKAKAQEAESASNTTLHFSLWWFILAMILLLLGAVVGSFALRRIFSLPDRDIARVAQRRLWRLVPIGAAVLILIELFVPQHGWYRGLIEWVVAAIVLFLMLRVSRAVTRLGANLFQYGMMVLFWIAMLILGMHVFT